MDARDLLCIKPCVFGSRNGEPDCEHHYQVSERNGNYFRTTHRCLNPGCTSKIVLELVSEGENLRMTRIARYHNGNIIDPDTLEERRYDKDGKVSRM